MVKNILPNSIIFLVVVLAQILIFNRIQFSGYVNPYIYLLFILLLPFDIPGWLLLILGFLTGMLIDISLHTYGMHAFATTLAAYMRPFLLKVIAPRDGYETGSSPRLMYLGLSWFFKYTLLIVIIHHFFLFFIEYFRFSEFFQILGKVLLSSVFSVIFIILSQFIVFKK